MWSSTELAILTGRPMGCMYSRCQSMPRALYRSEKVTDRSLLSSGEVGAPLVACADHLSSADSAATQGQGPARGPVIAPCVRVVMRSASEFTHGKHEGRVQQTSLFKVLQKSRKRLVQDRHQLIPVFSVVVAVRIPGIELVTGSGDEAAARLDQPTRQKHALAESVVPVRVLALLRFFGKVKGVPYGRRQDHVLGLPREGIPISLLGNSGLLPVTPVNDLQERATVFQSLQGDRLGQAQVWEFKIFLARVRDDQRVVFGRFELFFVLPVTLPLGRQNVRKVQ